MAFTQDFRTQRRNYNDGETRIGEKDRLWYDSNTNTIRISDGATPGGVIIGGVGGGGDYTLPTASTTVRGGVKIDGTTITISDGVISATQQDLSSYATQTYVTTRGYLTSYTETDPVFLAHAAHNVTSTKITNWDTAYSWGNHASAGYLTSVGTISYNDLTNKPTLFSGSYTDLTNKPTLFDGAYSSLTDKPTIPTTVSQLTNDSGYITDSVTTLSSLTLVGTLDELTIDSSSETPFSITSTGRPGSEYNTWSFFSNQGIGGPSSWIQFPDSTLQTTAYTGNADTVTNGVYTTDTGTVTNTMLAGSIANNKLANSSVTVNGTSISLGGSGTISLNSLVNGSYTLSVNSDGTITQPNGMFNTGTSQAILWSTNSSGAGATYRTASPSAGQPYQGTAYTNSSGFVVTQISGTPASGLTSKAWTFNWSGGLAFPDATTQTTAYTGNATTVTNGVYTTDTGTVTNTMLAGSIANAKLANSSITVNGTSISLGSSATVTAAAGTLTGTTLNSTVVSSSLTSVGTLTSLTSSGTVTINNAGVLAYGSGQLYINGATYSRIDFGEIYADPVVNSRSTGSRLIFNPGTGLGRMDSGIGMSTTTLWNSVQDPTFGFGWYAGDGLAGGSGAPVTLLTLSGAGVLTVPGGASVTSNSATNKNLSIGTHGQLFDDGNLHIHTSSGTLWINSLDSSDISIGTQYNSGTGSSVNIGKNLVANSGSVTANATTAFIAGANAVSNVSLQMPSESALRNLTNGFTNMYFDVSIGGSTHGAFKFRSSSSYTDVLIMSPTAVSFNTGATVTARTPALARTAFNSAIDTELTVNDLRFRISNQGGIFPQVISNTGGSKNLAWTGVGACSGAAVAQVGSTGTIVAHNAWTTLYNSHGMDSAGDTVTVTLQDKAGGAIYRITFMRSDNGSTTGYNIIGERIL